MTTVGTGPEKVAMVSTDYAYLRPSKVGKADPDWQPGSLQSDLYGMRELAMRDRFKALHSNVIRGLWRFPSHIGHPYSH